MKFSIGVDGIGGGGLATRIAALQARIADRAAARGSAASGKPGAKVEDKP